MTRWPARWRAGRWPSPVRWRIRLDVSIVMWPFHPRETSPMTRRHLAASARRLLAPALLLLLAACAGNTRPQSPGPACVGQIRLTITNDWSETVEIHRAGNVGTSPTLLGYVNAGGRREMLLPPGVREVYALWLDSNLSKPIPRQYRRLVRFRYECEPLS